MPKTQSPHKKFKLALERHGNQMAPYLQRNLGPSYSELQSMFDRMSVSGGARGGGMAINPIMPLAAVMMAGAMTRRGGRRGA
jgi:hypothetical protein